MNSDITLLVIIVIIVLGEEFIKRYNISIGKALVFGAAIGALNIFILNLTESKIQIGSNSKIFSISIIFFMSLISVASYPIKNWVFNKIKT